MFDRESGCEHPAMGVTGALEKVAGFKPASDPTFDAASDVMNITITGHSLGGSQVQMLCLRVWHPGTPHDRGDLVGDVRGGPYRAQVQSQGVEPLLVAHASPSSRDAMLTGAARVPTGAPHHVRVNHRLHSRLGRGYRDEVGRPWRRRRCCRRDGAVAGERRDNHVAAVSASPA